MPVTDWTPTPAEVGAQLRARTVDNVGNELGTFTDATRPTFDEVSQLIQQAIGEALVEHGDPDVPEDVDPTQLYAAMKREVILTTAMEIELSYFPEQVAANRSPYEALRLQRDRQQVLVGKAVQELQSGGKVGEGDDARLPQWNYPVQGNGMVGWGSRW